MSYDKPATRTQRSKLLSYLIEKRPSGEIKDKQLTSQLFRDKNPLYDLQLRLCIQVTKMLHFLPNVLKAVKPCRDLMLNSQ